MPDPDHFHPNLMRGQMLLGHDRPREALPFIQAAIAANPDNPQGYSVLAQCWNAIPAERSKALRAIDRAIALAPGSSYYFGLKGWILICAVRNHEALRAAQQGIQINPNCSQSMNSLANAWTKLHQWKNAEAACRRILEQNPYDAPGLNLLAQALRHQGRWKESRETVARLLANMPNNAFGQTNAGYGALAAGDHLRANEHFREALRLDPHFDLARRGLLSSLRARIWIIRFNTMIFSRVNRPITTDNIFYLFLIIFSIVGGCALLIIMFATLNSTAGFSVLSLLFSGLLFYIYMSAIVAIMGNFLLLFDPLGRHALTREEKAKACVPAFIFVVGMVLLIGNNQWLIAIALILFLAFLAFSIQFPLLKDRWVRRREKEASD